MTGSLRTTMRPLVGDALLGAWETAAALPELLRPLALLEVALPAHDAHALAELPLAERNRLLLAVRELTFGPELTAVADCSDCGAPLEFSIPAGELAAVSGEAPHAAAWTEGDREYTLRAATTADLIASLESPDVDTAEETLLARCLTVEPPGAEPARCSAAVLERFDALHAPAELRCPVICPDCGAGDVVDLDVGRFLWSEVRHAARRLLRDVDALAAAYGWSEHDILAMSAPRRSAYLEMVGS